MLRPLAHIALGGIMIVTGIVAVFTVAIGIAAALGYLYSILSVTARWFALGVIVTAVLWRSSMAVNREAAERQRWLNQPRRST